MARTFNWASMPEVNRPTNVQRGRKGPQVMDNGTHTRQWASYTTGVYENNDGVVRTLDGQAPRDGLHRMLKA